MRWNNITNKYCCEEFEKSIDSFIDKNDDGTYYITCTSAIDFHKFDNCWLRIKYCPFCGDRLPCKDGEHEYIPVLDERKSVCRICGEVE